MSQGLVISYNSCCFYLQYLVRCLDCGALLGLPSCKSESWRRYTDINILLVCEGVSSTCELTGMWGQHWGLLCGTSGREELCMVPCHSCHIYGILTSRSKKVKGMLRSYQLGGWGGVGGWQCKSQIRDSFHRKDRFSLGNTIVLWNFIVSFTGYIL